MKTSTPVVLLIYRRPELLRRVAERVHAANPPLLLVVADGPRDVSERALCEESRDVIRQFAWSGEVRWNAADSNLGLRRRVSSGIDWAFSQAERAIILEDDCLPEPSFFDYCDALLDRYRNDERVMEIAGSSLTADSVDTEDSYYFSKYYHPWGWATWRRAWILYDVNIGRWPEIKRRGGFPFDTWVEKRFWSTVFDRSHNAEFDTWDYQWLFAMLSNSGLSAVPKTNLVTNIGFGPGGTHYTADHSFGNMKPGALASISHPERMIWNAEADRAEFTAAGNRFLRLVRAELGRYRTRLRRWRDGAR
jgi:hypothetical protein